MEGPGVGRYKSTARDLGAYLCFEDEAGQGLRPPKGRTRAPYRWIITADPAEVERLRALHQLPAGYHNRRRWTDDGTLIDTSKDKEPGNHERGDLRSSH